MTPEHQQIVRKTALDLAEIDDLALKLHRLMLPLVGALGGAAETYEDTIHRLAAETGVDSDETTEAHKEFTALIDVLAHLDALASSLFAFGRLSDILSDTLDEISGDDA